jgi:hypothetical protein
LTPLDYARWAEVNPYFFQERHDLDHARHLQDWRRRWERSLPWWQRLRRRLLRGPLSGWLNLTMEA